MIKLGQATARPGAGAQGLLRVLTAAALAVGAYVHADLASTYDPVTHVVSQGDLFRITAGACALAALLLLLTARRAAWAFAFLVAAGAFGAIMLYRYVDLGRLGPLPGMFEPVWYPEKSAAAAAEGFAAVTALTGLVQAWRAGGRTAAPAADRTPSQNSPRRSVRW